MLIQSDSVSGGVMINLKYDELRKAALAVVMAEKLSSFHWPSNAVRWVKELEAVLEMHGNMPKGLKEFLRTDVGQEFFPGLAKEQAEYDKEKGDKS